MIFTSLKFIGFAACVLAGYFILPKKARWVWLCAASVCFYLLASVKLAVFFLFSAVSVWLCGIFLKKHKWVLPLVIVLNLGLLAVLKYSAFAVRNLNALPFLELPVPAFIVPLGMSFYTFTCIGYIIDVHREVCEPQKNPLKLLLFLLYFPHIMQGPIDRYGELAPQLYEGHAFDYDRAARGLRRALWGFFEKLVIADRLAMLVDPVFADAKSHGAAAVAIAIVAYAFQIYADFAGYMDIACGVSEVMGITLAENFNAPYLSESVPEFWRRWHITLGGFFRDYMFYPILRSRAFKRIKKKIKNRKLAGKITTVAALAAVWFATGLWHGAAWHYIAWGVYYGLLIILSELIKFKISLPKPLKIARTFLLVLLGYVIFRAESLFRVWEVLCRLTAINGPFTLGLDLADCLVAAFGCAVLILHDILKARDKRPGDVIAALPLPLRWTLVYGCVLATVIFGIYGPGYDAASFIYFQF